jgi:rhomboid protease GluP
MLPVMQTESFQRLRQEHAGFAENLARLGARAWVTPTLVGLNALVFVVAGLGGAGWFAPNGEVMLRFGTNYGPMTLDGQWWRLISAVFLHFGLVHLALNMWALYNAGQLAERLYGSFHFLLLYLFAGLGGSLASLLWNPAVNSAGASGAIFGVYGGLVAFFSRGGNQVPASIVSAQRSSTLTFIGYNLFFGLAHQGIDNAAHIGGLGTGAVLGWLLARPLDVERRRSMGYAHLAVAALVGLGLLAALAWPSLHPYGVRKQERQYTHDLRWLEQQEDGLNARYNDMAGQLDAGKLSEGDFIRRLESDTIPTLDGMFARIEQDSLDAASPFYPQRQFLERYFGLRRDGFRLYLKGLKENDKALQRQAMDQFNKAKQLMQEEEAKRK